MSQKHIKTKGIILGSKSLREADKLLFIYTREYGKIHAVARGALKPSSRFAGTTETLNLCTFELYKSSRSTTVTDIRLEKSYKRLREELTKITSALLITQLLDNLLLGEDYLPDLFELIDNTLKTIETTDKSLIVTTAFTIKFLDILGLLPNFKEESSFPIKLTQKYRKLFNFLKLNTFSSIQKIKLTKEETTKIKNLLTKIIENETGKTVKLPL
jgi:DNA repair protein RecO